MSPIFEYSIHWPGLCTTTFPEVLAYPSGILSHLNNVYNVQNWTQYWSIRISHQLHTSAMYSYSGSSSISVPPHSDLDNWLNSAKCWYQIQCCCISMSMCPDAYIELCVWPVEKTNSSRRWRHENNLISDWLWLETWRKQSWQIAAKVCPEPLRLASDLHHDHGVSYSHHHYHLLWQLMLSGVRRDMRGVSLWPSAVNHPAEHSICDTLSLPTPGLYAGANGWCYGAPLLLIQ